MWFATFVGPAVSAQPTELWRSWNQPVAPFRIVENVYYVGASDIAAYLITTPDGHILLETGFAETVPLVRASLRQLGIEPRDIRILLTSHAHIDHAGGLKAMKALTGARLIASAPEAAALARGGRGDFHYGDQLAFEPVTVDEIVADGGTVTLGGVTLTAHLTPGHTPGSTTWTCRVRTGGRELDVVFAASVSAPGYQLVNNAAYPDIWRDLQASIAALRALPCDVFLAPHGQVFGLTNKARRLAEHPETHPFIDPDGYRAFCDDAEARLRKQHAEQAAALEARNKR